MFHLCTSVSQFVLISNAVSYLKNSYLIDSRYQSQMRDALNRSVGFFLQPADKALLESWAVGANASKGNEPETRRSRKGRASALDQDQGDARAQKKQKAEDKKHSKWQSLGYHSLAIDDPGAGLQPDSSDDETGNDIHFVIGDCTQPVTTSADDTCIILSYTPYHCYAKFPPSCLLLLHYT